MLCNDIESLTELDIILPVSFAISVLQALTLYMLLQSCLMVSIFNEQALPTKATDLSEASYVTSKRHDQWLLYGSSESSGVSNCQRRSAEMALSSLKDLFTSK